MHKISLERTVSVTNEERKYAGREKSREGNFLGANIHVFNFKIHKYITNSKFKNRNV